MISHAMDLYFGMRIVAFVSFVLGVSTFTICGWTYLSNILTDQQFEPHDCDFFDGISNMTSPSIEDAFEIFKSVVFHATVIVMIVSVIQMVSAAVILGSALQGSRERAKIWFGLNLGVNIILLICPTMTVMYGQELQTIYPSCSIEIRHQILHLDSYYVGISINFVIQFHALLACLLMLRYDRGREYQLVEMT